MYFAARFAGWFQVRIPSTGPTQNGLLPYNEIPFSKFFGYICEHIFEAMRSFEEKHYQKYNLSMEDVFSQNPIKYSIVYRNIGLKKDQGVSSDVCDFQPAKGGGYGPKPSNYTREFNKEVFVVFSFENKPEWIDDFVEVWDELPISLHNHFGDSKKYRSKEIENIGFVPKKDEDYYVLSEFNKEDNDILNPDKMLFMFNSVNHLNSVYVNVESTSYVDFLPHKPFRKLKKYFKSTSVTLGE